MKYGFFHCRAQPFHLGHLAVCKYVLNENDRLIVGISNPFRSLIEHSEAPLELKEHLKNSRALEKNPFSYWQRYEMIERSLLGEGVSREKFIIVPRLAPVGQFGELLKELLPQKHECVVYVPQKDEHHKTYAEIYEKQGFNVRRLDVRRINELYSVGTLSGTKIRELIASKRVDWKKMVPKGSLEVINASLHRRTT